METKIGIIGHFECPNEPPEQILSDKSASFSKFERYNCDFLQGIGSLRFKITDQLLGRMIGRRHDLKEPNCELKSTFDFDKVLNYMPCLFLENYVADF